MYVWPSLTRLHLAGTTLDGPPSRVQCYSQDLRHTCDGSQSHAQLQRCRMMSMPFPLMLPACSSMMTLPVSPTPCVKHIIALKQSMRCGNIFLNYCSHSSIAIAISYCPCEHKKRPQAGAGWRTCRQQLCGTPSCGCTAGALQSPDRRMPGQCMRGSHAAEQSPAC